MYALQHPRTRTLHTIYNFCTFYFYLDVIVYALTFYHHVFHSCFHSHSSASWHTHSVPRHGHGSMHYVCISRLHSDLRKLFRLLWSATHEGFFLLALFWNTPTFIQMRLLAGIRKMCHFETAIKVNAQVVCIDHSAFTCSCALRVQ